jgi:hypothetical protein
MGLGKRFSRRESHTIKRTNMHALARVAGLFALATGCSYAFVPLASRMGLSTSIRPAASLHAGTRQKMCMSVR